MKKLIPWLRLGAFCFVLFALSALAVLLKQGRLLQDGQAGTPPGGEAPAGGGGTVKAGFDGAGARPAGGTEEARRAQSLATGRALFDLPEPISIADASDLMNELRRTKEDYEVRRAALDQREKDLAVMEREIEARRSEVLGMAERLQLNAPLAAVTDDGEPFDPKTLQALARILDSMQADEAARWLDQTPPEKAALVLLQMEDAKAAATMPLISPEKLPKLTEMLLRAKAPDEDGG